MINFIDLSTTIRRTREKEEKKGTRVKNDRMKAMPDSKRAKLEDRATREIDREMKREENETKEKYFSQNVSKHINFSGK